MSRIRSIALQSCDQVLCETVDHMARPKAYVRSGWSYNGENGRAWGSTEAERVGPFAPESS